MKLFALINEEKPRRTIMITESQAWDLLLEAATIQDIYQKYYTQIPQEIFQQIVSADPTYNPQKPNKMGKYAKWLLAIYQKGNLKTEDLYKATEYLRIFIKFNGKIEQKDIMKYKSLQDVYNVIQPFLQNPQQAATKAEEVRQIKEGAEKVYEDEKWMVIVPHTKEASCYYGKGTQWCTAADSSNNYFDAYNEEGLLYINILKGTDVKYQFHFETNSFMDATDTPIKQPIMSTIGLTDNLVAFYTEKYGIKALIAFKTSFNVDEITQIKGMPNYFTDADNSFYGREVHGTRLYKFNADYLDFDLKLDMSDNGLEIGVSSYHNRFIPIFEEEDNFMVNLYDSFTHKFLFDRVSIDFIEIMNMNTDYVIVHLKEDEYNTSKNIFSLKEMRFTCKTNLSENYRFLFLYDDNRNYKQDNFWHNFHYDSDIVLAVEENYDENEIISNGYKSVFPFSLSMGQPISNEGYRSYKQTQIYFNGHLLTFIALYKSSHRTDTDVLLFDGTIVPLSQFESESDQLIPQHLANSNN